MSEVITWFRARNMPTAFLRKSTGAEYQSPGWSRLQKHIAKHEKAGGMACISIRRLDEPIDVEGYQCVELADIELFEPLT